MQMLMGRFHIKKVWDFHVQIWNEYPELIFVQTQKNKFDI